MQIKIFNIPIDADDFMVEEMNHFLRAHKIIDIRTKYLHYTRLLNDETWSEAVYQEHILPLLSFAQHAESRLFRHSCLQIPEKGDNQRVAPTA